MVQASHGVHHFQRRKRIHLQHEQYPHPNKWKRLLDRMIYGVAIFGPVMTIPQLTKIWIEKNAAGVSALSWAAYLVAAIFWLIYGFAHKDKPIILTNILWIILHTLIVIGTLMYG